MTAGGGISATTPYDTTTYDTNTLNTFYANPCTDPTDPSCTTPATCTDATCLTTPTCTDDTCPNNTNVRKRHLLHNPYTPHRHYRSYVHHNASYAKIIWQAQVLRLSVIKSLRDACTERPLMSLIIICSYMKLCMKATRSCIYRLYCVARFWPDIKAMEHSLILASTGTLNMRSFFSNK